MAKMTAAELIANLKIMGKMKDDMLLKIMPKQCSQISALIEQQQQQIEQQAAEIAKKDSLICKLKTCRTCNFVMADRCDKHDRLIDNPMREKCDDWQWLEKEAQGVE